MEYVGSWQCTQWYRQPPASAGASGAAVHATTHTFLYVFTFLIALVGRKVLAYEFVRGGESIAVAMESAELYCGGNRTV